ncbi:hypothetical protein G5S35_22455 [Paraburkholderia tropica]|uniref:hypothetical protein n=1 Tax=Paraburkholderia tropica TaxID=92647 RepID=UPI0015FF53F3|nr:hypothetical protein [Paraburkholderia tropica]QNB14303.1 hypothetical protein G5S35_22455 [Paraburkholderia tropica]
MASWEKNEKYREQGAEVCYVTEVQSELEAVVLYRNIRDWWMQYYDPFDKDKYADSQLEAAYEEAVKAKKPVLQDIGEPVRLVIKFEGEPDCAVDMQKWFDRNGTFQGALALKTFQIIVNLYDLGGLTTFKLLF